MSKNGQKSIFRKDKNRENPYSMIANDAIRDERLSWKARGIHHYLLSLPDDWTIYLSELEKHSEKDGRDSLAAGIKELLTLGYLIREAVRTEKGTFSMWSYTVFEFAQVTQEASNADETGISSSNGKSDNGCTTTNGLSNSGKTNSGKPVTTNTYLTNTDLTNNLVDVVVSDQTISIEQWENIFDRKSTSNERTKIKRWLNDYGLILVRESFKQLEKNLIDIKSPGSYVNTILVQWNKKGFTTIEQIQADSKEFEDSKVCQLNQAKNVKKRTNKPKPSDKYENFYL